MIDHKTVRRYAEALHSELFRGRCIDDNNKIIIIKVALLDDIESYLLLYESRYAIDAARCVDVTCRKTS